MSIIGLKTKNGVNYDGLIYDDSQLRQLISQKVTQVTGKTLISEQQLTKLTTLENYDDSQLRQLIENSSANITQAVLNCEIPNDENAQFLDVTIKLCQNADMQTDLIEISNVSHYQIMHVAMDSQFVPLSQYYYQDEEGSPKISFSYYTGTLSIKLTAESVQGFDPNVAWYAVAIWSNGIVTSESQMIQFKYSGFCRMPRVDVV